MIFVYALTTIFRFLTSSILGNQKKTKMMMGFSEFFFWFVRKKKTKKKKMVFSEFFLVACDHGLEDWWTERKLTHTAGTAGEMG